MRLWICCAVLVSTATVTGPVGLIAQTFPRWSPICDGFDQTASIALGDMDGDRDLDVVFANGMHQAQPNHVLSNNGRGMFYGRRALGDTDPSFGVARGDLDGDGALDVVVANDQGLAPVYRNDGKGNFSRTALLGDYLAPQPRRAVALGDLDMDGDLDAVLVGLGQDHVYLNDGGGLRWTERAIAANREQPHVVYLNDGRGRFRKAAAFGSGREWTWTVVSGTWTWMAISTLWLGTSILATGAPISTETIAWTCLGVRPDRNRAGCISTMAAAGFLQEAL
jgi:hypothetical protein